MVLWASLYPHLLPLVPGAADPMLDRALCDAAREFYGRTRLWRVWLAPVTTLADQRSYALPLPDDTEAERIERARLDGAPFNVLSYTAPDVDVSSQDWRELGLVSDDLVSFTLTRELAADRQIRLQVSLKPSEAAPGVEHASLISYGKAIAQGAAGLLLSMEGRPWANAALAAQERGRFEAKVAEVVGKVHRGMTGTVPRARVKWC